MVKFMESSCYSQIKNHTWTHPHSFIDFFILSYKIKQLIDLCSLHFWQLLQCRFYILHSELIGTISEDGTMCYAPKASLLRSRHSPSNFRFQIIDLGAKNIILFREAPLFFPDAVQCRTKCCQRKWFGGRDRVKRVSGYFLDELEGLNSLSSLVSSLSL